MGFAIFSIILFGFLTILVLANGVDVNPVDPIPTNSTVFPDDPSIFDLPEGTLIMVFILSICYSIAIFLLSRFLFRAAVTRNYENVQRWYMISLALIVIRLVFYVTGLIFSMGMASFGIMGFLYQLYSLWVVGAFKEEMEVNRQFAGETTYLRPGVGLYDFKI